MTTAPPDSSVPAAMRNSAASMPSRSTATRATAAIACRVLSARMAAAEEANQNAAVPSLEAAEEALALVGRLEEVIRLGTPQQIRQALSPLVKRLTLTFRQAEEKDRKGRRASLRFVPDRMKLELHESLLNLFTPAALRCA